MKDFVTYEQIIKVTGYSNQKVLEYIKKRVECIGAKYGNDANSAGNNETTKAARENETDNKRARETEGRNGSSI